MKRTLIVGILVIVVLSLSACGSSKFKQTASTNPQVQQDVKQTETVVKSCLTKSSSKTALINCVAPKGHAKQLKACLIAATKHDIFHHVRLLKDYSYCVVSYR